MIKNLNFLKERGGDLLSWESLAQVEDIVKSPVVNGYRNKCEFSVGLHPETQEITVGFRLASYKKGSVSVVGVEDLPIVSDKMVQVTKHFEAFVRSSGLEPLNNISQKGYWKQLTVRTSNSGDCLVWVILHPQDMSQEAKDALKQKLKAHFEQFKYDGENAVEDKGVNSLHIQFFIRKEKGARIRCALETS